eukprot:scaffold99799_cov38-Prasinocladus_malaysianus.AAC.1
MTGHPCEQEQVTRSKGEASPSNNRAHTRLACRDSPVDSNDAKAPFVLPRGRFELHQGAIGPWSLMQSMQPLSESSVQMPRDIHADPMPLQHFGQRLHDTYPPPGASAADGAQRIVG